MPEQPSTSLGGVAFHTHADWCPKLSGYIDKHSYSYGYQSQILHVDKLAEEVTTAKAIPDFVKISHERKCINSHDAFETFGVAAVTGTNTRVLIRRVTFVRRPVQYDLREIRTCWFAATPAWMERMLVDSNEVLATFDFETGPIFPDSWISHYRRYEVDGERSEFVVYRLRPKHPVREQDIFQDDWCSKYGLAGTSQTLGFTTRKIAGVEAREISFMQDCGERELFGSRVFMPVGSELFVFQLITSGRHFGIERGRFEQVLGTVRLVSRTTRASTNNELRASNDTAALSPGMYDLEARREAVPWEEDLRGRTALEMRVLLRTLACVPAIRSRESAVYEFMRRRCIWVLESLDVGSPKQALEQQRFLFNQVLQNLPEDFDLVAQTSLTTNTIQRALTRPTGDTHIGTLARIAVALRCPLFGFDTCQESSPRRVPDAQGRRGSG